MAGLVFRTAGESHGGELLGVMEGLPSGLPVDTAAIDAELRRRQGGYGRGARQRIEEDRVELLAGIRAGRTLGSPLALRVRNRDARLESLPPVTRPRPGHADLAGALKHLTHDARDVLERASARETAARVALAGVARALLGRFGIEVTGYVREIGGIAGESREPGEVGARALAGERDASPFYMLGGAPGGEVRVAIDAARKAGETLGGVFEVWALGVPPGLGSCAQWCERLDALLAAAVMSIPAVKGVEIGLGFAAARAPGSRAHDEILHEKGRTPWGFHRPTNRAGGIEGGMTNGSPVVVRAAMKPIPTLARPLRSIDLVTKREEEAAYERSDVCSVPAASVVGEAMVALTLADVLRRKFGGDSLEEMESNHRSYLEALEGF